MDGISARIHCIRWRWFLLAFICISLVTSPWLIGWQIERQLRAPSTALQVEKIHRGWLETRANSYLFLPSGRIELKHYIEHGPYSIAWGQPALAAAQTVLPVTACHRLGLACGETAPVLNSLLAWDGASQHRLNVPFLASAQFVLQNLQAQLSVPSLTQTTAGALSALASPLQLQLQASLFSTATLELTHLKGELYGQNESRFFTLRTRVKAAKLGWQQQDWSDFDLELQANRLDAVLLLQLLNQASLADQLLTVQQWLAQKPVIELTKLSLAQEGLTAHGKAQLRPLAPQQLWSLLRQPTPQALLAGLLQRAELQLQVEQDLAAQLLATWYFGVHSVQALAEARARLAAWTQADLITRREDRFYARLLFKDNTLSFLNLVPMTTTHSH